MFYPSSILVAGKLLSPFPALGSQEKTRKEEEPTTSKEYD
jgi:hypothetical protein